MDVLVLSGLYTLRLLAGSAATGIAHLALAGRLRDLPVFLAGHRQAIRRAREPAPAAARRPKMAAAIWCADIEQLRSFGTASAFAAVVVFAIYISSSDVVMLYRRAQLLWLIVPLDDSLALPRVAAGLARRARRRSRWSSRSPTA